MPKAAGVQARSLHSDISFSGYIEFLEVVEQLYGTMFQYIQLYTYSNLWSVHHLQNQ